MRRPPREERNLIDGRVEPGFPGPIELEQIIPVVERAGILIATVYEGDVDLRTDSGQTFARIAVALARQFEEFESHRGARPAASASEAGTRNMP